MLSASRLSGGVVSRRIASSRFWIVFRSRSQRLFGIRRRSAPEETRPSPSDRAAPTPSRWRRAAGPPVSATSTRLPARRRSTARSASRTSRRAPYIVGYCLRPSTSRACAVHRVDHRAPGIDVLLIAGDEQRVAEPDQRPRNAIAVLAVAGHRIDRAESPAVGVLPPLALRAADACRRDRRSWE